MISSIMDAARLRPERRRLRRKPQKIDARPNSCQITCAVTEHEAHDIMSIFRWRKSKHDTATIQEKPCPTPLDIVEERKLAPPPVRKIEHVHHDNKPPIRRAYSTKSSSEPIPEFAHLRINSRNLDRPARDNAEPLRPMSFPAAPTYRPRRYAKTPVSRIGQLEGTVARSPVTVQKVPSIELIAESYRALLEPCYSVFKDTHTDLPQMDEQSEKSNSSHSLDLFPITPTKPSAESFENARIRGSPGSDDGTLVGFEEDAIYSRPIPCTSHLPTAIKEHEPSAPRPETPATPITPALGNPRLEISLDLLTQELSSAVLSTHLHPNTGTSALQIWVMIEAYEKLRDQLLEMQAGKDETILAMFDMWLKALHRIHDQIR